MNCKKLIISKIDKVMLKLFATDFGLPFETNQTIKLTIKLAKR